MFVKSVLMTGLCCMFALVPSSVPGADTSYATSLCGVVCVVDPEKSARADQSVRYKDGSIYFSCQAALERYRKNPAQFEAFANHQLVATKQYKQLTCPLSGEDLDEDSVQITVAGVDVVVLCEDCGKELATETRDYQIKMVFDAVAFEYGKFYANRANQVDVVSKPGRPFWRSLRPWTISRFRLNRNR